MSLPIYPGLVGFGVNTPAGRGGPIYRLTNLNDSGPGSLRAPCEASGKRQVICEVSGYVDLESWIKLYDPNISIYFQTAPPPGISIRPSDTCSNPFKFSIRTSDVYIDYLRVRGKKIIGYTNDDCLQITNDGTSPVDNVVVNHFSGSWSVDEVVELFNANGQSCDNVTLINSICTEAMDWNDHAYGPLLSGKNGSTRTNHAMIGILGSHCSARMPVAIKGHITAVFANMFGYNSEWDFFKFADDGGVSANARLSFLGNYVLQGPSQTGQRDGHIMDRVLWVTSAVATGAQIYTEDNKCKNQPAAPRTPAQEWLSVFDDSSADPQVTTPPISVPDFVPVASDDVPAYLSQNAGAWPGTRDAVDQRAVADMLTAIDEADPLLRPLPPGVSPGAGNYVDDETVVGGHPALAENVRTLTVPEDPHLVLSSGYTVFEKWIHDNFPTSASTVPSFVSYGTGGVARQDAAEAFQFALRSALSGKVDAPVEIRGGPFYYPSTIERPVVVVHSPKKTLIRRAKKNESFQVDATVSVIARSTFESEAREVQDQIPSAVRGEGDIRVSRISPVQRPERETTSMGKEVVILSRHVVGRQALPGS